MKLKHRKLVLIISMSAMGVGLITFSIAGSKDKKEDKTISVASSDAVITIEPTVVPTESSTETPAPTEQAAETPEATVTPTEEPEVTTEETPSVTPTKEPITLEEDAYPDINKLVKKYLQAKIDGNAKAMKKIVTDPKYFNIDDLQKETEVIESYDNIKVYTAKCKGDIDYIAFVYMELKIASIDTKGPGMNAFYIKKVDGKYKIAAGDVSDETGEYIKKIMECDDVKALSKKVEKKLTKAVKSDEALAEFYAKLDKLTSDK